jgi:cell growth-regulating nucleolar protein
MPSFVCDTCQETLKKAKLDQHAQRCRQASFSCIDCYKTFKGVEYRAHTSCITEVQKHHTIKNKDGQLVQPQKRQHHEVQQTPSKAAQPSVKKEEVAEELTLVLSKLSKEPRNLKDVLKAIKKGSEDKKARKAAKKWLQTHLLLSLSASGKSVDFKLE